MIEHPEWGDDPGLSHAAVRMPRRVELRTRDRRMDEQAHRRRDGGNGVAAAYPGDPGGRRAAPCSRWSTSSNAASISRIRAAFSNPAGLTCSGAYPSPLPQESPPSWTNTRSELREELPAPPPPRHGGPAEAVPGRPLAGLRVVAFVAFWAGPFVASYLAAMGADVVKVESIQRPDGMRFAGGVKLDDPLVYEWSAVTHGANVGLRDITLDLSRPEGADLAKRLVKGADIVLDNFSPRVLDGFGLSEADLRAAQPDIVILRMPAFGLDGPWRDRGGFAMTVEQNSGLAWLTGFTDDGPLVPRGVCDVLGGLHAIVALLAALEHRRLTGEGLLVEVPLAEAALNIAAEQTIEWTANEVLLSRNGNRSLPRRPQGVYECG